MCKKLTRVQKKFVFLYALFNIDKLYGLCNPRGGGPHIRDSIDWKNTIK